MLVCNWVNLDEIILIKRNAVGEKQIIKTNLYSINFAIRKT